jgi:putative transposase
MASKNSRKEYFENSYYHIYNRGVEKRDIFIDDQDYGVFLSYLKSYLLPQDKDKLLEEISQSGTDYRKRNKIIRILGLNNFSEVIDLLAYSLVPNHFHFLLFQSNQFGIDSFINSLCTRYAMYFNRKYQRVGHLYQDVYKAVRITSEEQLLHVSGYIHRNLLKNGSIKSAFSRDAIIDQPSSLADYLGFRKTEWVKTRTVLDYFSKDDPRKSYLDFVIGEKSNGKLIQKLLLDD